MQPVLTVAEMQRVDARAQAETPLEELVARAGTAVAVAALDLLGGAYGRRVVVIAGKGNNGADGRVAAGLLARRGARVTVVGPGEVGVIGADGPPVDLVIDAAFGTGFRGTYDAPRVAAGVPVLAVDIPSGVAGDTGAAGGAVLPATATVTFAARKPGLVQGDGVRLAGEVTVADIGLPLGDAWIALVEDADLADRLPPRDPGGNKWAAAVLVAAGSPGMTGPPPCARPPPTGPGRGWSASACRAGRSRTCRPPRPSGSPCRATGGPTSRWRWRPGAGPWWWDRDWVGPRAPGRRCGGWWRARRVRWWWTPTG